MKKRILSILLIFCMVLGFVPMTVFAETNFDSTWTELTSVHVVQCLQQANII